MELGQKLKQARLEAGLSQRQLCGDTITRNMLSQIENGTARPSMDTLSFMASRLGKSVSYFLEESVVTSPNSQVMERARAAWSKQDGASVRKILRDYQNPDTVFDWEYGLLWDLAALQMAQVALAENRRPYALSLLQECSDSPYSAVLAEKRQLLLARLDAKQALPNADELLLAKALQALQEKNAVRAGKFLDACENQTDRWHLLRGEAHFMQKEYAPAAEHFQAGEAAAPDTAIPRLEECYRALEDYKMAYFYACKRRK